MKVLLTLAAVLLAQQGQAVFKNSYHNTDKLYSPSLNADVGDPLILTPYLKSGKIEEAQQAALVQNPKFGNVVSYAGYFTVDEIFDSNLYFWFFPSADNVAEDPVVLWLNGGPGVSSLLGVFDENGPFIVHPNGSVSLREYSWHTNQSVLFVDNPVGVGFSFTNAGYAKNETKVGEDLYCALSQFFQLFPDLQKNDFFISGESYAGKYLPAIGHTILKNNPDADLKINLKGVLIGNGWIDPINQLNYGPFVYYLGLVSADVRDQIADQTKQGVAKMEAGDLMGGLEHWTNILALIQGNSGVSPYNYLHEYNFSEDWIALVTSDEIRKAIHVGDITYGDKGAASALAADIPVSAAAWLEELLENSRVLIYTGQVDIYSGYPMAVEYLSKLNFTSADVYKSSTRDIWFVEDETAGYVRTGGNLVELLVRNAGHYAIRDQPKWGAYMLYYFTRNLPFA